MPKLTRVRIVSVGHQNARFHDLTLNFQDDEEIPTDSTIWLRNGGGKSSLLNLFFAGVRPGRREFLGSREDKKELKEYVKKNDKSVVIYEWQLDGKSNQLAFADGDNRMLTGAFYEHRNGDLKYLYFTGRVSSKVPELSLESLPIFVCENGKPSRRRSLPAFKQEWSALHKRFPNLHISSTEVQSEWRRTLESAGIDTELFRYQLEMNRREGGADDLFRFRSHQQFVDFLLELVLDSSLAGTVRKNIEIHRKDLRRSIQQLKPESELVSGWIERLQPMQPVIQQRAELLQSVSTTAAQLSGLSIHSQQLLDKLNERSIDLRNKYDSELQEFEASEIKRDAANRLAAIYRYIAAEQRLNLATKDHRQKIEQEKVARRIMNTWDAAIPLRNALRFERRAKQHRNALEKLKSEHKPAYDELCLVATQYSFALGQQLDFLRKQQADNESETKSFESERDEARRRVTTCKVEFERFSNDLEQQNSFVKELELQRKRLIDNERMRQDESGTACLERINNEVSDVGRKKLKHQESIANLEATGVDLLREQEESLAFLVELQQQEIQTRKQLEEAEQLRSELQQNSTLLRILQSESIDILKLSDAFWNVIGDVGHQAVEKIVELKIARVDDQRAINHLEQHGLLPPSLDVQRVLGVLKPRVRAWSGWMYLSENMPSARAVRDGSTQAPSLAAGVIVAEDDFELAKQVIGESEIELASTVVVAPQSGIGSNELSVGVVFGPSTDALFDKAVANNEQAKRQLALDHYADQISDAEAWRSQISDLASDIRNFQQRFPSGSLADFRVDLKQYESRISENQQRKKKIEGRLDSLQTEIETKRTEVEQFGQQVTSLEYDKLAVTDFIEKYESKLDGVRNRIAELNASIQNNRKSEKQSTEKLKSRNQQIETLQGDRIVTIKEIVRCEAQHSEVNYVTDNSSIGKSESPLSELADDYRRLKSQYEHNVGESGFLLSIEENDQYASNARVKFADLLVGDIVEAEVLNILDTLDDPDQAEKYQQTARDKHASVRAASGGSGKGLGQFETNVNNAKQICDELKSGLELPPEHTPVDAEAAENMATENEAAADEFRVQSEAHFANADIAGNQRKDCEANAKSAADLYERMVGLQQRYDGLLGSAQTDDDGNRETPSDDVDELRASLKSIESRLLELNQTDQNLDHRRQQVARSLRRWSDDGKFESLKTELVRRLRAFDESELERQFEQLLKQLELRQQTIIAKLAEMDENRGQLVSELQAVANEGLAVLRSAANQSSLPQSIPKLAGSKFMTISMKVPEDRAEQRGRLASLVDEFVQTDELPTPMEMIQKSVQKLAQPIRIRVLNPDPIHDGQRIDISDLHKFSGGERLTCAVVLYCTLAELRAKKQGLAHRPTGVLLLDNPIGSASRVSFIKLQRDVARASRIQLIYTTGVNDYEALQPLPNLIRLRNDRVDRNNGQHMVELDSDDIHGIDAIRVGRKESPVTG